jgi:hypothetical protein
MIMRKIIILSFFVFTAGQIFSQKNNYLKFHGGLELPVGFFSEGYRTGWGIHVTDYLETNPGGSILFTAGVAGWKAKIGQGIKANLLIIRIGYRVFVAEGFYFQAEAGGVGFYLDEYNNGTRYTYAGGLGYLFNRKTNHSFDISSKFNRLGGRSWVSLNLGYQFKL